MFLAILSWLTAATPVWLSLLVIAALAAVAWQLWSLIKRIDRHAESIAHMDAWADMVDENLTSLQDRVRRPPPPPPPPPAPPAAPAPGLKPRQVLDLKKPWQK